MGFKYYFALSTVALSLTAWADGAPEVYGKVNIGLQYTDVEPGAIWEVKSNASRFGVKGDWTLSESSKAFYILEWEVDTSEAAGVNANIKSRNQAVGIQGDWGKALAGRYDSPLKVIQNKIDLFNDCEADIRVLFSGEARPNNLLQYGSPNWGGFSFNVATLLQETADNDTPTTEKRDGLFDAVSISAEYTIDKTLYLAAAIDQDHQTGTYQEGAKTLRLVAQYQLNAWQFGLLWQKQQEADGIDSNNDGNLSDTERLQFDLNKDGELNKTDGALVSVAYKLGENHLLKLQHGRSDIRAEGGEQISIGYDQRLAKNVTLFYWYTHEDQDAEDKERDILSAGFDVKF